MLDPRIVLVIAGTLLLIAGAMGETIAARRDRKVPTTATPTTRPTPTTIPLDVVAYPTPEAVEARHRREAEARRRRLHHEARLDGWNDRVRRARRKPIRMGWAIDPETVEHTWHQWREDAPQCGIVIIRGDDVRVETPDEQTLGAMTPLSARPTSSKRLAVYIGGAHLMYSIGKAHAEKGGIWWENDVSRLRPTQS